MFRGELAFNARPDRCLGPHTQGEGHAVCPKGAESLPQSGEEHLVIECVIPASPSQKVMGDQQPEW